MNWAPKLLDYRKLTCRTIHHPAQTQNEKEPNLIRCRFCYQWSLSSYTFYTDQLQGLNVNNYLSQWQINWLFASLRSRQVMQCANRCMIQAWMRVKCLLIGFFTTPVFSNRTSLCTRLYSRRNGGKSRGRGFFFLKKGSLFCYYYYSFCWE